MPHINTITERGAKGCKANITAVEDTSHMPTEEPMARWPMNPRRRAAANAQAVTTVNAIPPHSINV